MWWKWEYVPYIAAGGGLWAVISAGLTFWLMTLFYREGYTSRQWWRHETAITLRAYLLVFVCGGMLVVLVIELFFLFWWAILITVCVKQIRALARERRQKHDQPEGDHLQANLRGLARDSARGPGHASTL